MNENIKKLTSTKLGKISGGFSCVYGTSNNFTLSSDEKRVLEDAEFIIDGKLFHDKCSEAATLLKSKGFDGSETYLDFMYLGYKPPLLANLILVD